MKAAGDSICRTVCSTHCRHYRRTHGAGGMRFYHPDCLKHLRALANECGFLLIFDEIATGFGRTGKLFAAKWAGVSPDVLLVGKALTGGYLTQGAVVVSTGVAEVISASEHRILMHGPTFMGNPLASAVSARSLDLISGFIESNSQWQDNVPRISAVLRRCLAPARLLISVADVRVLEAIGVIELNEPVNIAELTVAALKQGMWVRPFRNLVYMMPTYICPDVELELMCSGLVTAIKEVHG